MIIDLKPIWQYNLIKNTLIFAIKIFKCMLNFDNDKLTSNINNEF